MRHRASAFAALFGRPLFRRVGVLEFPTSSGGTRLRGATGDNERRLESAVTREVENELLELMAKTRAPSIAVLPDGHLGIDKRCLGVRIGRRAIRCHQLRRHRS
jgi:hypothetical protein